MDVKRLHKAIEAINTYYAFAVLLYVAALYIASHNQYFVWLLIAITPLLAGWTGYLIKTLLDNRNLKYGFRIISEEMHYELLGNHRYKLRYNTKVKAANNRMMVFPMSYQWSGLGGGETPTLKDSTQKLIGVVANQDTASGLTKVLPLKESVSSEGDWNYWFVGFDHALYKGEEVEINYSQEFVDIKKTAKPCLYYLVNTSMERLELNVKFPPDLQPNNVKSSFFKLSDRRKSYPTKGVEYDADKQWATWKIENPKIGHCYRIDWQ